MPTGGVGSWKFLTRFAGVFKIIRKRNYFTYQISCGIVADNSNRAGLSALYELIGWN